jgi:hypothetical protein
MEPSVVGPTSTSGSVATSVGFAIVGLAGNPYTPGVGVDADADPASSFEAEQAEDAMIATTVAPHFSVPLHVSNNEVPSVDGRQVDVRAHRRRSA